MSQRVVGRRVAAAVWLAFSLCAGASAFEAAQPTARPVIVSAPPRATGAFDRCLRSGGPTLEWEPFAASGGPGGRTVVAAWVTVPADGAGVMMSATSFDSGETWSSPAPLPFSRCAGGDGRAERSSDPFVVSAADGRFHLAGLALSGDGGSSAPFNAIVLSSSLDGLRWGPPVVVAPDSGGRYIYDNIALAAFPQAPRTVLLATTRYDLTARPVRGPAVVFLSHDGGASWAPAVELSATPPGHRVSAPQIALTKSAAHIIYYTESRAKAELRLVSSSDGGRRWHAPQLIVDIARKPTYGETGTRSRIGKFEIRTGDDIVSAAGDPDSELLAVAFAAAPGGRLGVYLTTSSDSGSNWTPPVQVSDPRYPFAYLPTVALAGRSVAVTYLGRTPDPDSDTVVELNLARFEVDAGSVRPLGVSLIDRFDLSPTRRGTGDYQGLVRTGGDFKPVYVRTTCGGARACGVDDDHNLSDVVIAHNH